MVKYIARLKEGKTEILTDEELSIYLHLFSKEEIDLIKEIHYKNR